MSSLRSATISNGLAMFSMFFGAGNIIFPIMIGQMVSQGLFLALIGLILTAVLIPFSGLFAITLFDGSYEDFFKRMGKIPGYIVILLILALIGPFGGIPRCITLTFSTLKVYFTSMELFTFSIVASVVIFICAYKKSRIIDFIGIVLTPLLLIFLGFIAVKGIFFTPEKIEVVALSKGNPFLYGIKEGYNTMDLLAAFFFSSLICARLKKQTGEIKPGSNAYVKPVLKSCFIGASLLSIIYVAFSFVASNFAHGLKGVSLDELLGTLGHLVLGKQAGLVVCMAIALTCLTTAIALAVVSAEFIQKKITRGKLRYEYALIAVLLTSALVSSLEFSGIVRVIAPILQICYPALLMLSIINIFHKLYRFQPVKVPVFSILLIAGYMVGAKLVG